MSSRNLDEIGALLYSHLAGEALAGFPLLTRTPSSSTIQVLDYFDSLTPSYRESLLAALAQADALNFFPPMTVRPQIEALLATNPPFLHAVIAPEISARSLPSGPEGPMSGPPQHGSRCDRRAAQVQTAAGKPTWRPSHRQSRRFPGVIAKMCHPDSWCLSQTIDQDLYRPVTSRDTSRGTIRRRCRACRASPTG